MRVYQATSQPGVWYGKNFDDVVDLDLLTDENGQVLLGRCPFSGDGVITHYYDFSNAVIIIRVEYLGAISYEFLTVMDFNHPYWRGDTEVAYHDIEIEFSSPVGETSVPYALLSNHPNPFNPSTTINFFLEAPQQARLCIYDLAGRRVRVLQDELLEAGLHGIPWDGCDDSGQAVASGMYTVALETKNRSGQSKMMLVR